MDASSLFLGRKLAERIANKEAEYMRPLISGQAIDYADYKQRAGYLKALGDVQQWIAEINAEEDDHGRGPFARAS
jgi:hypothetical protein